MRMLLAGGGTGGHLFPAVALAQRLLEQEPKARVLFVGTERGIEARVLPGLGLPLETIDMSGFVGKGALEKLAVGPKLIRAVYQSMKILDRFAPEVVVGVGGYASLPVLLASRIKRIPFVLHEQNAWPGLTNRLLGRWADRICLSFADADRAFHCGRTVVTGNPLRAGMEDCPPISGEPCLLVFGGSRGARAINETMTAALCHLEPHRESLHIIHQSGADDLGRVRAAYAGAGWKKAEVHAFIEDMAEAYAKAHLVICRAGATTLAELTACGRPSMLIPYPFAAGDHQSANAHALARRGAAFMLPQRELTPEALASLVNDLLGDRERLLTMGGLAKSLGKIGAADLVLDQCRAVIRGK